MNFETELWRFETARFAVVWTIQPCDSLDLSWDETGEVAENLNEGVWGAFDSKVAVYLDGNEIAADYPSESIYADPADFRSNHRDPDPMNRNCSIMRERRGESGVIGHYFPDMVRTAVAEARQHIAELDLPRMRA